jgi:hypothetical protein
MSVSSLGGSTGAYSYLQSLLQQQQASDGSSSATGSDPIKELLAAFYPSGSSSGSAAASTPSTTTTGSGSGCISFSPDTMASLISAQGQQWSPDQSIASRAHNLFGEFDADGDGQISKSEFEGVFGSNADTSKVDGLFSALDANGDGSISEDELTSAAQQAHAHHHHHGPFGTEGGLAALLSSSNLTGATTQTSSNADGSTSTTISYADGSTVTMATPASASGSSDPSTGSSTGQSQSGGFGNLLERLIKMQADLLSSTVSQSSLATV